MSSLVGDLWPSDLVEAVPSSTITIMKEQALRLGQKTENLVLGDVRPEMDKRQVNLIFELVMPLLENYRYGLFKVSYPAQKVYPLDIYVMGPNKTPVERPEDFVGVIRGILNSEQVKTVINSFVDMQRPHPIETGLEVEQEA